MSSDRHQRVATLIQSVAATYIQHEANTDPLITVTHVTISPDYRRATIYYTTIPNDREAAAGIFLKRMASDLRQHLKRTCNLKIIPHLDFDLDVGERHRQHIDTITHKIERGEV
jgi:ribosome-binding factor A